MRKADASAAQPRAGNRRLARRGVARVPLAPLGGSIECVDCPAVAAGLKTILRGWEREEPETLDRTLVRIVRTGKKYDWVSSLYPAPKKWTASPPESGFEVICELQFELIDWLTRRNPSHFSLHSAAVEIAGGLIVFPSPRRAGKSTLTLQLAAAGFRVFCDDVLAIEPEQHRGIAPGILPRIRLPIARSAGAAFRAYVGARAGLADADYHYVALSDGELAPYGAEARIRALVVLDRIRAGVAAMTPVTQGEMLKHIIRRNAADQVPARDIFERFHAITASAERFKLTYAKGNDAVALLVEKFAASGLQPCEG